MLLEPHKHLDVVAMSKSTGDAFAVLPDAFHQIGCDADVKRSSVTACQDVYAGKPRRQQVDSSVMVWLLEPVCDHQCGGSDAIGGRSSMKRIDRFRAEEPRCSGMFGIDNMGSRFRGNDGGERE